jgi:translation elongation factor EF-4
MGQHYSKLLLFFFIIFQEFGCSVITTAPTVPYYAMVHPKKGSGTTELQKILIDSPKSFPDPTGK